MPVYFLEPIVMSYNATVYNIMIASPGDVDGEKQIVRDTIYEWNAAHSEHEKVVLLPRAWETHSIPVTGERAQSILNKQVLSNSDLLIAVFWTRIGTSTGVAASGTVEEIDEHVKAGKPAWLYFSTAPVSLVDVNLDQYKALEEFRELCKKKGLYATYGDPNEFRQMFSRQLASAIDSPDYFKTHKKLDTSNDFGALAAGQKKLEEKLQEVEKKANKPPRWG